MVSIVAMEGRSVQRPLKELIVLIKEDLAHAREAAERAGMPYYKAIGEKLLEAKPQLNRGEFMPWYKLHFKLSHTTANIYMKLAAATRDEIAGRPAFTSLNDFAKQTGDSSYREVRTKQSWHDDVKSGIERAREEAKRLHEETLSRQQEREAERKLALKLIDIGYRILSKELHPDRGGTRDAMSRLSRVRDRLKQHA